MKKQRMNIKRKRDILEYSGLGVHAVRWLGNRLAII